jgi:hypothetical protein
MHKIFQGKHQNPNHQYVQQACKGWGLVVSHHNLRQKHLGWQHELDMIYHLLSCTTDQSKKEQLVSRQTFLDHLLYTTQYDLESYEDQIEEMLYTYQD